jgi:hypothetical protein
MDKQEALRRIEAAEKEIAEAKKALEESDEPKPGDWCVFWLDGVIPFSSYSEVKKLHSISGNKYFDDNISKWDNCRRITPEDFGWKLGGKPDWKDAPDWANYLAQDANGGWWWYDDSPKSSVKSWLNGTRHAAAMAVFNWRETLESRPK